MKKSTGLIAAGVMIISGLLLLSRVPLPLTNAPTQQFTQAPTSPLPFFEVEITADGEKISVTSDDPMPINWLAEAGIPLFPGDHVFLNGEPLQEGLMPPGEGLLRLDVDRAHRIVVTDGLRTEEMYTRAPTIGQALFEGGVTLFDGDRISQPGTEPVLGPVEIEISRSVKIQVRLGEQTLSIQSAAKTVGEALAENGLALQGLDYSIPAMDEPIPNNRQVRIVRVREIVEIEQEAVPFDTLTQLTPDLEIDQTQIIQAGEFGLNARRVRIRFEDGVEVGREVEAAWVAAVPKARIVGYGTKVIVRTLSTGGGTIEYWRAVPAFATSYSPCRLGTEACNDVTASGRTLQRGVVGVIRSWYNVMSGSRVYVPGYGAGVVSDIGSGVSSQHWIDLGYSDDDWESWSENVIIYFLTPVPPEDQILWVLP